MDTADWVVAVVGWTGSASILLAYLLLSARRIPGESIFYQVLNIYGALGLVVAAWVGRVWPAVTLNIIWASIGVVALTRRGRRAASPGHQDAGAGRGGQPAGPTAH